MDVDVVTGSKGETNKPGNAVGLPIGQIRIRSMSVLSPLWFYVLFSIKEMGLIQVHGPIRVNMPEPSQKSCLKKLKKLKNLQLFENSWIQIKSNPSQSCSLPKVSLLSTVVSLHTKEL